jgi:hypothetical protein
MLGAMGGQGKKRRWRRVPHARAARSKAVVTAVLLSSGREREAALGMMNTKMTTERTFCLLMGLLHLPPAASEAPPALGPPPQESTRGRSWRLQGGASVGRLRHGNDLGEQNSEKAYAI